MAKFRWTEAKSKAVELLAQGYTIEEAAQEAGCSTRSISRWKNKTEFAIELDKCSHMFGLASSAERLRQINRAARQFVDQRTGIIRTGNKDHLDYIKEARMETDGVKLNLVRDIETIVEANRSGSESGSRGNPALPDSEE